MFTKTLHIGAASAFALLLNFACANDVGPNEAVGSAGARGTTAQEIEDGSCEASCGTQSPDGCWCDDECQNYNDCCSDYISECAQPIQCVGILCAPGTMPTDTDGDVCPDACVPVESECFDDSMCNDNQRCVAITGGQCCPPNAACDLSMPPCDGECVDVEPTCETDSDCENGFCEMFATCAALNCPPPPPNQCVTPDCNDGTTPVCLITTMPMCKDSEVLAQRDGCFSCVDARTCEPTPPPPPVSTCEESCGGQSSDSSCWCDSQCSSLGDCCADFADFCG